MTIGQKITHLRTNMNISQEKLADMLGVSRQSVSKWEMDQALPQIDKILQIANIFSISCDELLKDEVVLSSCTESGANKYFGTDGFRGEANISLTSMHAFMVGRFLGWFFLRENSDKSRRPRIVIG